MRGYENGELGRAMLTSVTIRNFKLLEQVEIELGSPVVFIGPNNSGKTSAMQALALWDAGLKRWNERRSRTGAPESRPGVTVNRRDLVSIPVPNARLLWHDLHVRTISRDADSQRTQNVRIDVVVKGITSRREWECGLEFDYANEESFYCRPLRLDGGEKPERMSIPEEAGAVKMAFLPPMSGLAATETRLDPGAVDVRVGEGRTAEVLRNLCFRIYEEHPGHWKRLADHVERLFGARIEPPRYIPERGEIAMSYREQVSLDLSSSGRGLQQTLLLLAYMYANPGAVLLLDEPDAHLEILRQRQIYKLISQVASESGNQIIAASHSEILLNEAAGTDMVVAFVGQPHRIDDRGGQVLKSLKDIGFEQYYQAEQNGWVLYLEGPTDLAILQAFARRLQHEDAIRALERPFVHYVGNQLSRAESHYHGLREALPKLQGIAILDDLTGGQSGGGLECLDWRRREIENYLCTRAALEAYAESSAQSDTEREGPAPLFVTPEVNRRTDAMRKAINEIESAMETLGRGSPWDVDAKVSDDFLTPLFSAYFKELGLPNLMQKSSFYRLAEHISGDEIDPEVIEKLDAIGRIATASGPG